MRWDEETGAVSVFRKPSNNANGNTRDRQGRLLTCEHDARRVTRTEYDGTITVIADRSTASRSTRRTTSCASPTARSGSPTRRSASSATTRATSRSRSCRRTCTAWTRQTETARRRGRRRRTGPTASRSRPTSRSSTSSRRASRRASIRAYDVVDGGTRLANKRTLDRRRAHGTPDGLRVDVDGNLWVGWGMGDEGLDGVVDLQPRRASRSAASTCPSAAPTSASAAAIATGCSCAAARRCTRCT